MRKRILFIGESALAHVSRPLALARTLDPDLYDISFACDPRYRPFVDENPALRFHPISGVPAGALIEAADRGDFPWDEEALRRCVADELDLFRRVDPALVIADYRLTVSISARLAGIPCASLINVYWSPFRQLPFESNPDLSLLYGHAEGRERRSATALTNLVRRSFSLPLLNGFCEVATAGDYALYADAPGLLATSPLPDNHVYLGPVTWSPAVPRPVWWPELEGGRPVVYVTLGSTGAVSLLPALINTLARLPVTLVVATAGRIELNELPGNVFVADYVPGEEVCRRASLVVCNGGSPTAYQALANGVPILGIWSNLDQYLMAMIAADRGAGLCVPASTLEWPSLRDMAGRMLEEDGFRARANEIRLHIAGFDYRERFPDFVRRIA